MRKAFGLALGGLGAITLAATATAASRNTHVLNVPLPDGSTARVEYVGDIAPKVTVLPAQTPFAFPAFGLFDRNMFDVQRQLDAMMRDIRGISDPAAAGREPMNVAAYGNVPAGATSVTVITTSDGSKTCTRRTEVISAGPGKAPKVATSASGNCRSGTTPKGANSV